MHIGSEITSSASSALGMSLDEAQNIKRESKINTARQRIIKNINKRAIVIVEKLEDAYLDDTDIKGLIGEMILEDMAHFHNHIAICPKWRKSGSSKSNGLDLISYKDTKRGKKLVVAESKHLHDGVKGHPKRHVAIRDKCVEAIEQSDPNHILCSLSDALARFGHHIAFAKAAAKSSPAELEEKYELMQKAFSDCNYELWFSIFVDEQYCADADYKGCISKLSEPLPEYGDSMTVEIIGIKNLEEGTESLCGKFVK